MFKSTVFAIVLLSAAALQAACEPADPLLPSGRLAELRAAYFSPTGHKFRKIYSGTGLYSAEVSCRTCHNWYSWASVGYTHKSGSSIGLHTKTDATLVPFALGLKYVYPVECLCPYLGAGVLGTYIHTHDHSSAVTQKISRWGIGAIAKSGVLITISRHLFLDLFVDYSFMRVDFNRHHNHVTPHSADLSGASTGIGVGCRF